MSALRSNARPGAHGRAFEARLQMLEVMAMVALLASDVPAERPCTPLGEGERITVDFDEAPLFDVARLVSCALEKNFLFQPTTLGERRVTVLGPRPVGRRDLLALWRAVLAQNDLVEERHGAFEVIRPVRK